jgi:S-disulfanyl-L-cysteine oxidoreductase SoxD
MTMRKILGTLAVSTSMIISFSAQAENMNPALGEIIGTQKLKVLDRNIHTDGRGLPEGYGTVNAGREIYAQQCASCHGQSGIEGPAPRMAGAPGPLNLSNPFMALTVGGMWPYATSIFDYIRRAMPPYNPKSLNSNEVYSLTAYILYLNGLVKENTVIDAESLPKVEMPALRKAKSAWPDWTVPDTAD